MPTPAYTELNSAAPSGGASPTVYSGSDLTNVAALRDHAIAGRVAGFVQTRTNGTGTANQPQYIDWINATLTLGFRAELTWTAEKPTTIQWWWSNDNGATWVVMGSAQVNTFDASYNITASTNSGGFFNILLEVWAKCLKVVSDFATHIAATGAAVHGLASMAIQAASAIAVTGGTINGTSVGLTTPALSRFLRVLEAAVDIAQSADAGTATMDLATGSDFTMQPSTTASHTMTIAVSNPPASGQSQGFFFAIINGRRSADAKIIWPASFKWVGGSATRPVDTALELSGRNLFSAVTRDGGTTYDVQHLGKRG